MSNGCGCESSILKWFKPPYAEMFYVPCCMHDNDYDHGGDGLDRWIADRWLYRRMIQIIYKDYTQNYYVCTKLSSPWKILKLVMIANIYYISVRLFGRFYFNYSNKDK